MPREVNLTGISMLFLATSDEEDKYGGKKKHFSNAFERVHFSAVKLSCFHLGRNMQISLDLRYYVGTFPVSSTLP